MLWALCGVAFKLVLGGGLRRPDHWKVCPLNDQELMERVIVRPILSTLLEPYGTQVCHCTLPSPSPPGCTTRNPVSEVFSAIRGSMGVLALVQVKLDDESQNKRQRARSSNKWAERTQTGRAAAQHLTGR